MKKIALIIILSLVVAGCSDVLVYDKLPADAPKGYVEFYGVGQTSFHGVTWSVLKKKEKGKYRKLTTGPIWSGDQKRRIADIPGTQTYVLSLNAAMCEVTVDVIEGMIIPIKVIINVGEVEVSQGVGRQNYSLSAEVEEPIPFVK